MCLGIPGKFVEISEQNDLPMGKVEFGGILKESAWPTRPRPKWATTCWFTSVSPSAVSMRPSARDDGPPERNRRKHATIAAYVPTPPTQSAAVLRSQI